MATATIVLQTADGTPHMRQITTETHSLRQIILGPINAAITEMLKGDPANWTSFVVTVRP